MVSKLQKPIKWFRKSYWNRKFGNNDLYSPNCSYYKYNTLWRVWPCLPRKFTSCTLIIIKLRKYSLVIANTLFQQQKRRLYTYTSLDGQYRNQTDYILCSQRWRSSIQSVKTRSWADCGSDHELVMAKLRLKMKKVGKTPRPFRYDPNQIPYDYTVEVGNRFKGLDLTERVPEELWTEVCNIVREQWSRPSLRKRNAKRQNGCLRRPYK